MAFTLKEVAIRARNLITERSPARADVTIPHIQALVPTALEVWSRTIKADPSRYTLMTGDATIVLAGDSVDITPLLNGTTGSFDLDDVSRTTLYVVVAGVRVPLTWVASQAQLNNTRYLASSHPSVFLQSNTLQTRGATNATIQFFDVFQYPQTVTAIPFNLRQEFIVFLATMALKEKQEKAASGN